MRELQKLFECRGREVPDRTDPFSHLVDDLIKRVIQVFKKLVLAVEIRAFHVPMCLPGFGNEYHLVCENLAQ